MIKTVKVYDNDVRGLLSKLDGIARNFDSKYGLPLKVDSLRQTVYDWLYAASQQVIEADARYPRVRVVLSGIQCLGEIRRSNCDGTFAVFVDGIQHDLPPEVVEPC